MRLILVSMAVSLAGASDGGGPSPIQPGQWEMVTEYLSLDAPGIPEAALEQMRAEGLRPTTSRRCITPAEAADPMREILRGVPAEGCSYDETAFAEGRINVRVTCPGPEGESQTRMTWTGSYTETTMTGDYSTEVIWPETVMRMTGTLEARRIGDCEGE